MNSKMTFQDWTSAVWAEWHKLDDVMLYLNDQGHLKMASIRKLLDYVPFVDTAAELVAWLNSEELDYDERRLVMNLYTRPMLNSLERIAREEAGE